MLKDRFGPDEFCLDLVDDQLLSLISDGLIQAYLLHAEPPFITQVLASGPTLQRFWFLITPKGEQCLRSSLNDLCDGDRSESGTLDASMNLAPRYPRDGLTSGDPVLR
jgi:hypothetical protein